MYEVYKNDAITTYTDDGGQTNTAYEGELRVGTDFFTGAELATEDEVISRRLICDRCGFQPKEKSELTKQNGFMVCWRCIDG